MRYRGQAFEINTPWAGVEAVTADSLAQFVSAFHRLHQSRYAHSAEEDPVEIVTVRAKRSGCWKVAIVSVAAESAGEAGAREIWHGGEWRAIPGVPRDHIGAEPLAGPLLVDEAYSALWIAAGWRIRARESGDLLAERQGEGRS